MIGCEWFHARSRWAPFHCPHSHTCSVGLTAGEWFHARYGMCALWLSLLPLWSCWPDRKWVTSSYVQLEPFWISSHLLLSCWLNSRWVISCQIQLDAHSHPHLIGLTGSEWFHTKSSWVPSNQWHSYCANNVGLLGSEWFHAKSS